MGLTKNGRKILGGALKYSSSTGGKSLSSLKLINTNNETASSGLASSSLVGDSVGPYKSTKYNDINQVYTLNSSTGSATNIGVCLGSGTSAETVDDYTLTSLSGELTGNNISILTANNLYIISASLTVINETSEAITVNEVGLGLWYIPIESHASDAENALLFRKVLPEPVTILPEETYTFTLVLK